jgi:hypothetical protein
LGDFRGERVELTNYPARDAKDAIALASELLPVSKRTNSLRSEPLAECKGELGYTAGVPIDLAAPESAAKLSGRGASRAH